jgi:undecaprenyl-diphosphatase
MEMTAIALWLNTVFAGLDESVAVAVHKLYEIAPGFFTPFLTLITYMGRGGIFLILLSFALMLFRPTRRIGTTMLLAISIGALITNLTVKPLVARPRPYTWDGSVFQQYWIQLGRHTESDKSFPSGHMTAAMAASTAVFLRGNRKISWTAFLFAVLMGLSRIYLSVHYTTDVLGAVITGGVGGTLGYLVSKKIPEFFYEGDVRDLFPGNRQKGRHSADRGEAAKRRRIVIDGDDFSDLDGFYDQVSSLLGSPEDKPIRSMDAFNDLLRGGFGDIEPGEELHILWRNADKSRADLGYAATAAYYQRLLERCHPDNREKIRKRLDRALAGEGDTLFDLICGVIRRTDSGHDCRLELA